MSAAGDYNVVKTSLGASIIRTYVPIIVGAAGGLLAKAKLSVDGDALSSLVTAGVGVVYYTGVRLLEEKVSPIWGRLLGVARVPTYDSDDHYVDVEEDAEE